MSSSSLRLTRGAYVGDVTALCALPSRPPPPSDGDSESTRAARDTLLAGTGASLQWYDPLGGGGDTPALSATVFGAARVHGIVPAPEFDATVAPVGGSRSGADPHPPRAVLVWGERRVALVAIVAGPDVPASARDMRVVATLPPLGHWAHDARPLRPDASHPRPTVAVGLADNAVEQWTLGGAGDPDGDDAFAPRCLRRVECAMRSMLYSLALRGSTMADLEVAGGTIFNEVQLWAPRDAPPRPDPDPASDPDPDLVDAERRRPAPWAILRGHEGSIMRVTWADDGAHVFSTSDDRTARAWSTPPRDRAARDAPVVVAARLVAFGHTARVWDCRAAKAGKRPLLITAGEDCTVRLWDAPADLAPGNAHPSPRTTRDDDAAAATATLDVPVAVLRGHRGRGVWRALTLRAENGADVLVTAGADASIKLWDLSEHAEANADDATPAAAALETFASRPPGDAAAEDAEPTAGVTDSKGEYVRALALAAPDVLFVATNRGVLHRATIRRESDGGWTWREAWRAASATETGTETGTPIMSVALLDPAKDGSARVALGDGAGKVSIVAVAAGVEPETRTEASWSATAPRRLLDVFRCADGSVFTSEVGGEVRRWRAPETEGGEWKLAGTARVPFGRRVLATAYHARSGLSVFGDQNGNVAAFADSDRDDDDGGDREGDNVSELKLLAAARSAHGQQAVSLVEIRGDAVGRSDDWEGLEIVTGGRDGRLCSFELRGAATTSAAEAESLRARLENETRAATAAKAAAEAAANGDGSNHAAAKRAAKAAAAAAARVEMAKGAMAAKAAPRRFACVAKQQLPAISAVEALRWNDARGGAGETESPALAAGFKETFFVVHDLANQCELLRAPCGGWHRPRTLRLDPEGDGAFTFAFCQGGKITALRRAPDAGAARRRAGGANWNMRTLNGWSHGREIHTVAIVPPPSDAPDAPVGVLTGSEDGSVLRASYERVSGVSDRRLRKSAEAGSHAGGTAVRAVALVPERPGGGLGADRPAGAIERDTPASYILLTAGAKEVLHAWRVAWSPLARREEPPPRKDEGASVEDDGASASAEWELRVSLVATRGALEKEGHATWKKGCVSVAASTASDQRYMDVAGFVPESESESESGSGSSSNGACAAIVASSMGAVSVMSLDGATGRRGRGAGGGSVGWRVAARLRHHDRPALAVAVASVDVWDGPARRTATVACTGATDGAVAAWDLTAVAASIADGRGANLTDDDATELAPAGVFPGAHQSGVNGLALARAPGGAPGRLLLATGGDDQTFRVAALRVAPRDDGGAGFAVSALAVTAVDFAHSSAIKGVWMDARGVAATTSHDQRLRVWRADVEEEDGDGEAGGSVRVRVEPAAGSFVECPEPEGLDALAGADGRTRVAVSGRGVQMFLLE